MNSVSRFDYKTHLLLPMIFVLAPLGNVLLSKGMKGIGAKMRWTPGNLWPIFIRIFTSAYIWLGITSLLAFFFVYMLVLTRADYSYVQPSSALSYAVVSFLGYFWLGEIVTPLRWVGVGIICVGVFMIVRTPHRTTPRTNCEMTEEA
jgi:drug/metabolite transporter (DMT)-like permease